MRRMEYDVVDLNGSSDDQRSALNAAGADGWVLVHLEHQGITVARAYFAREARDDGYDQSDVGSQPKAQALAVDHPATGEDIEAQPAVTVENAESVVVQEAAETKPDAPQSVETSGSADGDTAASI